MLKNISKSCSIIFENIAQFVNMVLRGQMSIDKNSYKSRIVDSTIKTYLGVSGAVCIEGPKWCGKTWTSAYHSKSEFMVGAPKIIFQIEN